MSAAKTAYNWVLRRNSTFLPAIIVSAFFLEIAGDGVCNRIFREYNRGKLFEDVIADVEARRAQEESD